MIQEIIIDMIHEMVRECRHDTRDGHRLRAGMKQDVIRECKHDTKDWHKFMSMIAKP